MITFIIGEIENFAGGNPLRNIHTAKEEKEEPNF